MASTFMPRPSVQAHLQRCKAEQIRSQRVPRGTSSRRMAAAGRTLPQACKTLQVLGQLWPRSIDGSALRRCCACSLGARRKINCSGGTCHGRSAARFRSTVEKPRTFVIPFCVLALWTFGGIAGRITSKVGSQRYPFVMIDAEPTLRCVIFIRMMDLCRQLCLPGRPFLELQDLLVLAATCVSAQSISAPHDMTAQRLASNQMPKFANCVES